MTLSVALSCAQLCEPATAATSVKAAKPGIATDIAFMASTQGGRQFLHELEQVADEPVVGDAEDRCLRVLVDRDDHLRILHAGEVLDGARDACRDVQLRSDDLAGL